MIDCSQSRPDRSVRPSLVTWFRSVLATPVVVSEHDYFDRLDRSSELSAPLRQQP